MFKRYEPKLITSPSCYKPIENITVSDFQYYDKDGFELNRAEEKYYDAMGYPVDHNILNHTCWQQPWFELETGHSDLLLDHSIFLCRCNYSGAALEQLKSLEKTIPYANLLINTRIKWGFDFALDAIADDGTVYEVLHVEYDSYNYDHFSNRMINFDYVVRHTDWHNAARRVWEQRDQWQNLKSFDQNHWKSNYLLRWERAEYTEKAI